MNTYTFFYQIECLGVTTELSWTVKARRLSQALTHFYLDSKSFACPVSLFLPRYEVMNSKGKCFSRLLSFKIMLSSPFNEVKIESKT